jgi:hypothetical protein
MKHEDRAKVFDHVMRDALGHLTKIGWEHDDADQSYIDMVYDRWLEQTREEWKLTGIRTGNRCAKRSANTSGDAMAKRPVRRSGLSRSSIWN